MLFKYTFPVTTSLVLTEHWPISVEGLRFDWDTQDGLVTAISVVVPITEEDLLPKVERSGVKGTTLNIEIGSRPHIDRVEHALRTAQGLLYLFSAIDIHFDRYEACWIAESKEEEEQIELLSFTQKLEKIDPYKPRHLSYNLVGRIFSSINAASSFEIPLNFLRRGNREIRDGRLIEAFYNLFFFLETIYAPGYSNPSKVKEKLCNSSKVIQSLAPTRSKLLQITNGDRAGARILGLLGLSDEDLLGHLVNVRGYLHHHALPRPEMWHPDKPDQFRAEVMILQRLVYEISMAEMMPILGSAERDQDLFNNAEDAGAILKISVETIHDNCGTEVKREPVIFRVPGLKVSKEIVNWVNYELRKNFTIDSEDGELRQLKITSEDGKHLYGIYKRF